MRALGLWRVSAFYAALVALAAAGMQLTGVGFAHVVPAGARAWLVAATAGVGAGVAMVAVSRLLVRRFAWASRLAAELRSVLGDLHPREAVVVAIVSGVGEEVLFRGLLQPLAGVVPAAAVFGALHVGPNRRYWPWTVMAFGAGVVLGLLAVATASLAAPVLAHATVNFLNLRFLAVKDRRPIVELGAVSEESVTS